MIITVDDILITARKPEQFQQTKTKSEIQSASTDVKMWHHQQQTNHLRSLIGTLTCDTLTRSDMM